jgi:hypothetical protein
MIRGFISIAATVVVAAGCASAPKPSGEEVADACLLLKENRNWYKAMRASEKEWGAPIGYQLAVVRQESSFDRKARPEREGGFLFFPGKRPSTAYGYAQALETTWEVYKRDTGNRGADRHSFRDSADFIGWYFDKTRDMTGLGRQDFKGHYLAYHEGQNGYLRGGWKKKKWLVQAADRVAANARTYERQIDDCDALKPKFLGIF